LLVTIIATVRPRLGFERWIASRLTHSALSRLEIDAEIGIQPPATLAQTLKTILANPDKATTAGSSRPAS